MRPLLVLGVLAGAGAGYRLLTRRRCGARAISERADDGTEIVYVEERCRSLWEELTGTGGPGRNRQSGGVAVAGAESGVGAFFADLGARWDALRARERMRSTWREVFGPDVPLD